MSGESVWLVNQCLVSQCVCMVSRCVCTVSVSSECVVSTRVGGLVCLVSQCVCMVSTVSAW